MAYTKLDAGIVHSTIWQQPHPTRIVWITMLALADQHGEVMGSIPGLAHIARVTVPECEEALRAFLSPDPYSRNPAHEGRRIAVIPGGWQLLSHADYRRRGSAEERRAQAAERQRRHRARAGASGALGPDLAKPAEPDVTQKRDSSVTDCDMSRKVRISRYRSIKQKHRTGEKAGSRRSTRSSVQEKDNKLPSEVADASPARVSRKPGWMAPAAAVWEARFGSGTWDYAKHARSLRRLHDAGVEAAEVARRLAHYLAATNPQYVSIPRFVETFGGWTTPTTGTTRQEQGRAALRSALSRREEAQHGQHADHRALPSAVS